MDKSRTGMVLLLVLLWPCVWGMSHYEVKEGHNLVLKWDCPRSLDLSALALDCHLKSNNSKPQMLYMFRGGKSDGDEQFSGRMQCDREALKQGRVELVFSRLTPQDSGEYTCYMCAEEIGSWRFMFLEHFNISVLPSETTTAAPTSGVTPSNGMSHFEEKEGRKLILKWDCPRSLDLSALTINCQLISNNKHLQMLYMVRGEEKRRDEQFSERVQCDREALKQGQVKIAFSRLTARDSGEYFCDMYAEDSGWTFMFYERFNISVLPPETTTAAPTSGATPSDAATENTCSTIVRIVIKAIILGIGIIIVIVLGLMYKWNNTQSRMAPKPDLKHKN